MIKKFIPIFILLISMLFIGCTNSEYSYYDNDFDTYFNLKVVKRGFGRKIIIDDNTGVLYLGHSVYGGFSITPILKANGTPLNIRDIEKH